MTAAAWVTASAATALFALGISTSNARFSLSAHEWQLVAAAGVTSALAFVCLLSALPRIGAARAGIISTSELLVVVILGWVVLGEAISIGTMISAMFVVVGIALAAGDNLSVAGTDTTSRTSRRQRRSRPSTQ